MEVNSPPYTLVFFGATGDLFQSKLLPALFQLHKTSLLHPDTLVFGCGRTNMDDAAFHDFIETTLPRGIAKQDKDIFLSRFSYCRVDPAYKESFIALREKLDAVDYSIPRSRLYYLAVPPTANESLIANLSESGLMEEEDHSQNGFRHILLEKPFGTDLDSAGDLDTFLLKHADEHQYFRIDHYLGKDTVQNIMIMRFANLIFEPIWNSQYIDHIQISVSEKGGIGGRAGYYDKAGAVRDMFQNHLLEILALIAMEKPATFDAESIRRVKLQLFNAIRPFSEEEIGINPVRGQYAGYKNEAGVAPDSRAETFAALRLWIDNPRWKGVPFYLRSGKCLSETVSTVTISFKSLSNSFFENEPPNKLTLRIQPNEGMCLNLRAKHPGPKFCIGDLPLAFCYSDLGDTSSAPNGYARLLLDAMLHDHTLFVHRETIAASWRFFTPILKIWENDPDAYHLHQYEQGSQGPAASDELMAHDGRAWEQIKLDIPIGR
jgi:glucose-6-phosphate 1-dehydrogenase